MSRYATTIEAACEGDAMNDDMIMVSREPVHPGEFLREDYMSELGLTVATLAKRLGVSRQTVNDIVREKRGLSRRCAFAWDACSAQRPEFWMNMQSKVDIWDSLALHEDEVMAIEPIEIAAIA